MHDIVAKVAAARIKGLSKIRERGKMRDTER
jgi:hypothetical protein